MISHHFCYIIILLIRSRFREGGYTVSKKSKLDIMVGNVEAAHHMKLTYILVCWGLELTTNLLKTEYLIAIWKILMGKVMFVKLNRNSTPRKSVFFFLIYKFSEPVFKAGRKQKAQWYMHSFFHIKTLTCKTFLFHVWNKWFVSCCCGWAFFSILFNFSFYFHIIILAEILLLTCRCSKEFYLGVGLAVPKSTLLFFFFNTELFSLPSFHLV